MTWSKLKETIESHDSFILSSHVNPDGDCICSQLALYWYICSLGKQAVIFNTNPVPSKFHFLENSDKIVTDHPSKKFDVLVILDASNPGRIGWEGYEEIASYIVNIDHHKDNSRFGHLNIINCDAAATSLMLYEFFQACSISYPSSIAETIYAGILTDTGGFAFSNTDKEVLRICAGLAELGADCSEIYRKIYSSYSTQGLKLRAKIWSTLKLYHNNRICSMEISTEQIDNLGIFYGDIEGMSDQALIGSDVEVGLFIKYSEDTTHFSLRSKGTVDVGKIAQAIPGGGGHTCAAGCTIDLPLDKAIEKMLAMIKEKLG